MDDTTALLIASVEDRRRLAVAMAEALRADAFDKPADPDDLAHWEAEIVACDAQLADLLRDQA